MALISNRKEAISYAMFHDLKGFKPRLKKNNNPGYFPGGPVVMTPCFQGRGREFNPWLRS